MRTRIYNVIYGASWGGDDCPHENQFEEESACVDVTIYDSQNLIVLLQVTKIVHTVLSSRTKRIEIWYFIF